MATIQPQTPVTLSQEWGVSFSDYKVNGKPVDFQDLMIEIGANRAVTVEGEVAPLTTRIKTRNVELDRLGSLLAIFTKTQADDPGPTWRYDWANSDWTKSSVEGMIQALKSMIDGRNNKAQTDMTRLQQLVDRRDESFSTASSLMTSVSDTRGNLIRNL